jgi:membrane fusion protein (multidrug efflux system)
MNFRNTHALLLCSTGIFLLGCSKPQPKQGSPDVGVVVIKTEPAQLTTILPGRTESFAVSDIRPQVGGILKARLFIEGALVRQGQPLYQIDPAPYKAAYDNATAVLAAAKPQHSHWTMDRNIPSPDGCSSARSAWTRQQAP